MHKIDVISNMNKYKFIYSFYDYFYSFNFKRFYKKRCLEFIVNKTINKFFNLESSLNLCKIPIDFNIANLKDIIINKINYNNNINNNFNVVELMNNIENYSTELAKDNNKLIDMTIEILHELKDRVTLIKETEDNKVYLILQTYESLRMLEINLKHKSIVKGNYLV